MDGLVTGKRGTFFKKRDSNTTFSELLQVVKNLRCSFFFAGENVLRAGGKNHLNQLMGCIYLKATYLTGKKEKKENKIG